MPRRLRNNVEAVPAVGNIANEPMDIANDGNENHDAVSENPPENIRKVFNPEDYGPVEVPPAHEKVACSRSGPRLMITKIDNHFFKSYANTQTLGPFNKCFTAIIGPNGSGKSNVIDAMLFVFGYRASKIRSKKVSELIHVSDNHPNVNSCKVTVHFQMIEDTGPGVDEYTIIPDTQLNISRTAFRDNSSFYTVNGVRKTYKEVAVILRGHGIDLDHNRFLILQGEVEQIAMMKPMAQTEHEEGMLEFLEDIIGSNRYKQPIEILYKRVEELNEFRVEKVNRVKVLEREKLDLEGPRNDALAYLQLENDITLKKNLLYHKYIQECTIEMDKASVERDRIQSSVTELNDKLSAVDEKRKGLQEQNKIHSNKHGNLTSEVERLKEQFTNYEKQDVKCTEDRKHAETNVKKIQKNIEQEKKKIETLKKVPSENEGKVSKLKEDIATYEMDKKKAEEGLSEVMKTLKTETKNWQDEKEKNETQLLDLQNDVDKTKSKYEVTKSQLDLFLQNQQKEKSRLETLTNTLQTATDTLQTKTQEMNKLQNAITQKSNDYNKAKQDLQTARQTYESASTKVNALRSKTEVAKSSIDSVKSRGRVLEALMNQKQQNLIPGLYGRLGDLGGIDEKYDVAISTSCGMLDHIVCDTIDTAQTCVEFLKKSGSGVASFIGLDKMTKWIPYTEKKITTPENVPRLFDLVKVQDKDVLPAFYFALRDTLVAKDLEQATRIAYGKTRYRVVTLNGQLIDQSGTMSGGGSAVCRGRMGSSAITESEYTPEQVKTMEVQLDQFEAQCRESRSNKDNLEDCIQKIEHELTKIKQLKQSCQVEIKAAEDQERRLSVQIKEQEEIVKASAPDVKEVKVIQDKVNSEKKDYDCALSKFSKIEDVVKMLHKKIIDYGEEKIKPFQSKTDELSKKITDGMATITKLNVSVKTAERNLKKAEEKLGVLEKEAVENDEQIAKLNALYSTIETEAGQVFELTEACRGEIQEVAVELAKIKEQLSAYDREDEQIKKDKIEIVQELDKYDGLVKDNQQRMKHWKKELSKLKLNEINRGDSENLPIVGNDDLADIDATGVKYQITLGEEKLGKTKPNMAAIDEYREKEDVYLEKVKELENITNVRNEQRNMYDSMRKERLLEFMEGFGAITLKLKEVYRMITLGGDAELELVNSLDPFSDGIVFSVRPPFKSWKNICNLSGGEKTLSSLALVFALHYYKPTPLYVMDEIDAALDFKNVSIVGNYIMERTKNAQFIIISLRNNMFELAERLVGIYKVNNCTQSVTIDPKLMTIPEHVLPLTTIQV